MSVIFAVGTVVATFLLARRIFGERTAVAGSACSSLTAPLAIQYAQTARSYTMVMFFSVLSTLLLMRAIDRPSVARLACYVASIIAAMYSHDFAFLCVVAQGCWFVIDASVPHRFDGSWWRPSRSLLLVPQAAVVIHTRGFVVDWIPPLSLYRIKETAYGRRRKVSPPPSAV